MNFFNIRRVSWRKAKYNLIRHQSNYEERTMILTCLVMQYRFSQPDGKHRTILPSGANVTLYMQGCSHYEMRENKRDLSYGFPLTVHKNSENAT